MAHLDFSQILNFPSSYIFQPPDLTKFDPTQVKTESDANFNGIQYSYRDSEEGSPCSSNSCDPSYNADFCEDVKPDIKNKFNSFSDLPKNVCPTTCVICGDSASGYHYEVPSCNGCKTFFRRTVLAEKKYECKKDGKCFEKLPKERRCTCRACRFQQCVDVGMNPLAIQMANGEEVENNAMVKEIIKKRTIETSEEPSTSREIKRIPSLIVSLQDKVHRMIDELSYLEFKSEKFRRCKYNPEGNNIPTLDFLVQNSCSFDLAERLGPMPGWPLQDFAPLTDDQLKDWRSGNNKGPRRFDEKRKDWLPYDLLVSVEYAKTFPFFHKLSFQDRKHLLRSVGLLCCNLTQAFHSYKIKASELINPDGTQRNSLWKNSKNFTNSVKYTKRALNSLIRSEITEKEYLLLKAISLCNAGASKMSDTGKKLVLEEQKRLTEALLNYCLHQFGKDGPARFSSNIAIVDTLEHMSKDMRDFHLLLILTIPTKRKIPLVIEIMDL